MKKFTLIACIVGVLSLLLFSSNNVRASHAAGGELIYEWVSDSTYRFYFKFYRDCTGIGEPSSVSMCYTNTCTNQTSSITLTKMTSLPGGVSNGTQVSTGCANQPSTCVSSTSTIPGYREWWYSNTVTLPLKCNYWRFGVSINARNASQNIGQGTFYAEVIFNNSLAQGNSSPVFSVKPVPYVCLNSPYKYNNGGVDPNGDSVAFEVIRPLINNNCSSTNTPAIWQSATPAYSIPTNPFQTNNTFSISATTGELSFTPGLLGAHTVSVKANEYRDGIFIGSVMRDIQVQVINCSGGGGTTPTLTVDPASIGGSATYTGGTVFGCAQKPMSFCFDAKSTDPNAKIVVNDNSGAALPGATVTYTNLQSDSVRGCVTWTPNPTDTGTRVFVVTVKDSACSSNGIAISHSITVPVYVWAVTAALSDTAICSGDSVQLIGVGGTAYIWSAVPGGSGTSSLSCTTCKSPVAKPTTTTSYILTSNSSTVCNQNTDTVTVTVIQQFANGTSNSPVCPGDTLKLFGNSAPGLTYIWTGPNGFSASTKDPFIPNAQSVNSGTYGVQVTNGVCSSSVFYFNVYVGPPAGPAASSNSPVCEGTQLILTATTVSGTNVTYNWSGPNSFSSTQQNPMINNVALTDSGKYYVYAEIDGCNSFMDSVTIKVNDRPAPPITNPDTFTYCQDITATPLTATGSNLKWYTSATGGTGVSSLTPPTTTAVVTKYYVSQTNGNGCESERDSVTVIIIAKPANPTVTPNVYYCKDETAVPLTASGTNLQWYTTPTGGTSIGSAPTPSTSTPGNTIYFVSQTDATTGCESDRTPVTVTVYPIPSAPVTTGPANYCVGGPTTPVVQSFVTGQNILWYTSATGGTGSINPPTINTATASLDTYYVSQTINGCEGVRAMLIVEIIANPAPPQPVDTAYCQFATAVPVVANGQNILWYTSATGGTGSTTAPTPSTTTAGTFYFYVSQTVRGCESERDSVEVIVHPEPQPPVGDDDSICEASIASPLTATGQNLLWYTSATGGIGSSTAPTPSTTTPGTYFWYVSQSINGCESDRDTVEIEVVPKPAQPLGDSAEFCYNGPSMQLTATGQNLLWYTGPIGGTGSTIAPIPPTNNLGTLYYYVTQTIDGCESDRDTVKVVVDTLLSANILASNKFFCLYDSIEVEEGGQVPDTAIFTWTWDNGNVISGDSSGPYVIKWDAPGVKTITLFANDNGCKANDTLEVEVLPLPQVYFDMKPEICADEELVHNADSLLQYVKTYTWNFDSTKTTIINVDSNKFNVLWKEAGERIVSLYTVSDSGCISNVIFDTINVRDYPKPQILPLANNTICTKTEIKIGVKPLTDGLYKYEWTPEEYFLTNRTSSVSAVVPSSGFIKVSATDEYGCTGTDSVHLGVKLCCKAILPNAFSPNGDGRNDEFGIISTGNYKISAFRIVNRYGQQVFSTTNQQERWDGSFKGEQQSIGTYYYYIKYSCEDDDADNEVEERGDVTLIR